MDPHTERLIRTEIRLRLAPLYLAFFLFVGSIVAFGLIGAMGFIDKFLRSSGVLH